MRAKGLVTISGITLADGTSIPLQKAIDYGWIKGAQSAPAGWGVGRDEISLGENLFLDQGRQLLAYAFAFRAPIEDYTCQKFGVGTGTTAPKVIDTTLEAPILLSSTSAYTAPIDSIDFLAAFVVRVGFSVATSDANGYLLTELGLYSGNDTLVARKIRSVGINKTSDFSPALTWRLRF